MNEEIKMRNRRGVMAAIAKCGGIIEKSWRHEGIWRAWRGENPAA